MQKDKDIFGISKKAEDELVQRNKDEFNQQMEKMDKFYKSMDELINAIGKENIKKILIRKKGKEEWDCFHL